MRGSITGLPDALLAAVSTAAQGSSTKKTPRPTAAAKPAPTSRGFSGPRGVVALHITSSAGSATLNYLCRDQLGSLGGRTPAGNDLPMPFSAHVPPAR
ncbi:MAG: hypothetical protein ABL985_14775 [Casimicrobium sp.]